MFIINTLRYIPCTVCLFTTWWCTIHSSFKAQW